MKSNQKSLGALHKSSSNLLSHRTGQRSDVREAAKLNKWPDLTSYRETNRGAGLGPATKMTKLRLGPPPSIQSATVLKENKKPTGQWPKKEACQEFSGSYMRSNRSKGSRKRTAAATVLESSTQATLLCKIDLSTHNIERTTEHMNPPTPGLGPHRMAACYSEQVPTKNNSMVSLSD